MKIGIIGGGAAGLMAAGTAAENGAQVLLFEKNEKVGRKLYITGKGRCNVCNNCEVETALQNTLCNARFLYSALYGWTPQDVMAFFEEKGVALKTERGGRVFPQSDKAADIIDALFFWLRGLPVRIINESVDAVEKTQDGFAIHSGKNTAYVDRVIVATGGISYAGTGSTGDGYRIAQAFGHTVIKPRGSLVPLVTEGDTCKKLMGVSLRNVTLTVFENDKRIFSELGEMLFTHFGISGPLVLSASAHMRHFGSKAYRAEINLKPGLDESTLEKRILSDFEAYRNSDFINALGDLLPRKLIPVVVERSGIDARCKVHSIRKEQRRALVHLLQHFELVITGARPAEEAIVTRGGVSVKEVSPNTLESKKETGLYFAGEVLDVDAYTGGFNLQIAWSTGRLAGESAAKEAGV